MPKALKPILDAALDMSRRARMARARAQGFDERPLYHGTADDIAGFDLARADDAEGRAMALGLGRGKVYLTDEPAAAASFATRRAEQRSGARPRFDWREHDPGDIEGANILPVRARGPFLPEDEYRERFRNLTRGIRLDDASVDTESRDQAIAVLDRQLIEEGYAGIENAVTGQVAVFDPANIRSTFAAFDPAKRNSSNLLAGVGSAAVGAGLLATPQDSAAEFRRRRSDKRSPYRDMQYNMARFLMETGEPTSITALPDNWMTRAGQYLTETRPSEQDAIQRALTRTGQLQALGEYLIKTGQGDRTTALENLAAGLDISPI